MNKLLDDYLCKKYPKIFADRRNPMSQTCMCWGFPGNGWFHILDTLCGSIQQHIDNSPYQEAKTVRNWLGKWWNKLVWNPIIYPIAEKCLKFQSYVVCYHYLSYQPRYVPSPIPQVVATQVKEKFGGLRVYFNGGDDLIHGMVSMAEALSYHVCEDCGALNELVSQNSKGWVKTACIRCVEGKNKASHEENQNQELIEIFKRVRKEKTLTPKEQMERQFKIIAEVENYK